MLVGMVVAIVGVGTVLRRESPRRGGFGGPIAAR